MAGEDAHDNSPGAHSDAEQQQLMLRMRRRAMDILARREHSRFELSGKLASRFEESTAELIDAILDQLESDGLLSDRRFAESFVRVRQDKGYGPLYILSRLNQRGVSGDVVDAVLEEQDPDWFAIAESALRRKTAGDSVRDEERQKSRLLRFLASRGFTGEQSHKALQQLLLEVDDHG
ncbi:MAG: regulatory protein RecX [Pseudomonadota bacterium]